MLPPQLSSRYGPVLSLRLGSERAVVVSGVAALRELLVTRGDEFTSRGHFAIGEKLSADLGLFMSNGDKWISMRRFALTALRDAGMGSRRAEEMAMEEAAELIRELEKGGSEWGIYDGGWDPKNGAETPKIVGVGSQYGVVGPQNGGRDPEAWDPKKRGWGPKMRGDGSGGGS